MLPGLLMAQATGWTEFLATWRKAYHPPATLLVPKDRLTPAYPRSDETLLLLGATGELGVQSMEGPALESLRAARGWTDNKHWILLSQDGVSLDEGTDLPTGEYLQSRLQAAGIPSTWEALESFIRLHPDQGSALQQRLSIATRLARRRFQNLRDQGKVEGATLSTETGLPRLLPAKSKDLDLPGDWCREVEETLKHLNQLPDPWRLGDRMLFQIWLDLYGRIASPGLREGLRKLNDSVLQAWRCSPHSGRDMEQTALEEGASMGLGAFWLSCAAASQPPETYPELPLLTPAPGRFWPNSALLMTLPWSQPEPGTAQAVLAFLDRLPAEEMALGLWHDPWSEWLQYRAYVSLLRAMALGNLGRWQEAASALQEARRLSGKQWLETASGLSELSVNRASLNPLGKPKALAKELPPEVFLQVLRLPPLEPPPPPIPAPTLRFLVWGQPDWMARWESLRASAALAPWSSSELTKDVPGEADTTKLLQAGFPATGWAVFQGAATIVARGETVPDAGSLAMQLRSVAPSRIHLLDDFIAANPEHLDARRDRLALIQPRLPQATLEARLREDAAKTLRALDFGPDAPWITDLEGWRTQARKVVPELEVLLRRWPDNQGLWRAWIAWSAFLPKPPAVAVFAEGLPVFGSRQIWISRLPQQVHRAVASECRKGRQFGPMANWFEGAWAGLQARTQNLDPSQAEAREVAIYEGYREALTALGRKTDRVELERAWAILQAKAKEARESN